MSILIVALSLATWNLKVNSPKVQAQANAESSMEQRLNQVIGVLAQSRSCQAVESAVEHGMEILYGGLRPLPSAGELQEQTEKADQNIRVQEMRLAEALENFTRGRNCPEQQGKVLDLKLFIEEMNEVAQAVGQVTRDCGEGGDLNEPPCNELQPLLNEEEAQIEFISPSFSVKLRSPFIPWWLSRWQETDLATDALAVGECSVVFKETKGLAIRLHFERVSLVRDPWVATFGVPRGTLIPIWALEWVPTEYVKEWEICNTEEGIEKNVTQHVKQDLPLNFFWRYY